MEIIMTQLISLRGVPRELKIELLKELCYGSDGTYVLSKNDEKHLDKYTQEPVRLDNMLILPGSTVIIDNNPLSVSSYMEEYGDVI